MKTQLENSFQQFISSDLLKHQVYKMCEQVSRDRIGQWAVESDAEIAGLISGLERMRVGKFNKVSL